MKIVKASLQDLELIEPLFDLYRQFYKQKTDINSGRTFLSERIKNNESVIFLAIDEEKNTGMGFVQLYPMFSSVSLKNLWILNDLFVHEDYRKNRVGQELIERSKGLAVETGAKGLMLQTHFSNNKAQGLYDRTGFVKDNEFFTYTWRVSISE